MGGTWEGIDERQACPGFLWSQDVRKDSYPLDHRIHSIIISLRT
jgi:hypothetical protein